ncbi:hypothetical protein O6H91_05G047800 [Diphasiastrum complanatum]|uniref:Uncharacterized protein n=1 Tax=Diphasiastrum complanatum TaxID=34168 RepID=A0ACC2DN86_DIPCM|nr:hypothetical protein O6H91_05G047800 [Diphasiastrum complanatum]
MGDAEGLGLSLGLAQHSNIAGGAGDREGKLLSAGSQSQQQPRMQVDEMEGKETGKDAVAWSAQATAALLDVYAERWSAMNCRNFRGEEWEELARNVNNRCSFIACKDVKNGKQCSYKMSNLKRKYKNEKELLRLRGGVSEWKWFCRMEQIFSSHPKYLWYVVYAGEGAERLDKDAADNTFEDPNSCSLSASKSASTTNTDGGFLPQCEMPMDSSPCSNTCRLRGAVVGKPSRKKHAISTRVDDFAVGISESMKMIAQQQGEMIALMREMVASQDKQLYARNTRLRYYHYKRSCKDQKENRIY